MIINNSIVIKPSPLHGLGVFATKDLEPNTRLHKGHIFQDGIQIRSGYIGFYNYSEEPNCKLLISNTIINKKRFKYNVLTTIKPIKTGEELTLKYTWYNPLLPETEDNKGWNPLSKNITLNKDYNIIALEKIKKNTIIGVTHCQLNHNNKFVETCLGCFLKESDNYNAKLVAFDGWNKDNKKIPATYKLKTIKDIIT